MSQFALKGHRSRELLTWNGKVIVHNNEAELRFLFKNAEPVKVNVSDEECLPLWVHPDMEHVRFPLRLEDFRR